MNKSLKALLLSVLVYPGIGHVFLKKYITAFALVTSFSIPLYLVVAELINKTNQVIARIESGEIPLDNAAITDAISQLMAGGDGDALDLKIIVMSAIWIVAAVDAYRIGKHVK